MNRVLVWVGLLFTLGYVVLVAVMVDDRFSEVQNLKLNEVGDFLAGVFGPVTIVWLILGFLQQGMELRQNNEALKLQAEELRNSVEQQRELVGVTRSQVAAEMEALQHSRNETLRSMQPIFVMSGGGGSHSGDGKHTLNLTLTNMGAPVTDVSLRFSGDFKDFSRPSRVMDRSDYEMFTVAFTGSGEGLRDELEVVYLDAANNPGLYKFEVEVDSSGLHPRLKTTKLPT